MAGPQQRRRLFEVGDRGFEAAGLDGTIRHVLVRRRRERDVDIRAAENESRSMRRLSPNRAGKPQVIRDFYNVGLNRTSAKSPAADHSGPRRDVYGKTMQPAADGRPRQSIRFITCRREPISLIRKGGLGKPNPPFFAGTPWITP
jgi:hypothetical protein